MQFYLILIKMAWWHRNADLLVSENCHLLQTEGTITGPMARAGVQLIEYTVFRPSPNDVSGLNRRFLNSKKAAVAAFLFSADVLIA
jgi:hypothetical protein